jgi:hypothetical protein
MNIRVLRFLSVLVLLLGSTMFGAVSGHAGGGGQTVFATGLNNPRGLTFGPDGALYVAEGGTGGTSTTTAQQCQQVPAPVGPYSGGFTASISKIDPSGHRTVVANGLPSDQTSAASGNLVSGVAAVAFHGSKLYGIEAAAGCSHGLLGTSNTVFRVNRDGTTRPIADLSAFIQANPTAVENPPDFEPDGTWYSMVLANGAFYAVEPNHGEVDRVTVGGHISRLIDVSAAVTASCSQPFECGSPFGHVVPTSVTFHNGNFYLVNLDVFDPGFQDHSHVYVVTTRGSFTTLAGGLNAAVGVAFDQQGRLYALEAFTGFFAPAPFTAFTGTVLRWNGSGWDTIATGLNFPTAMTFGPDGNLYVSNCGFGCGPGDGQIVRISV